MKFILIFLMLVAPMSWAGAKQITASAPAPIKTTYDSASTQSQVIECIGNMIKILNQTDSVLAFGFGRVNSTPQADYSFVPPGPNSGHAFKNSTVAGSGTYIYIRAPNAEEDSGTVQVSCTTED